MATAKILLVQPGAATANRIALIGCDPNSSNWSLSYTQDAAGNVQAVTVSSIASTCNGAQLYLRLTNGTTITGTGPVAVVTAGTAVVTLTLQPLYSNVTHANIAVVGP